MCGIVGYWSTKIADRKVVERMALKLSHRGPDDAGSWLDKKAGVAFAHRRLAIIDLSPAGHQPMVSVCGRFVLVYNGEIYNHEKLRSELENENLYSIWRGHSDTETLLAALISWGIEKTLKRLNGMFAFALWDKKEQILYLARDRMGEKPLYYGRCGNSFLFGSQLRAFFPHPEWEGTIDLNALCLFLRHNYVPTPWCIFQGVKKLPPAHFIIVSNAGNSISAPRCYWSLRKVAEKGLANQTNDAESLKEELDSLLRDATRIRMTADVPLGAFLSGGVDSSTIVALMQAQSSRPIKTFTIGFYEKAFDEAKHAKAIAEYLGTDHTELYITPKEALDIIPDLAEVWDEPFSDSSQIPTYLLSKLTRKYVTVSLSGDGGDELFYGYNRYIQAWQIWRNARLLPHFLRKIIGSTLHRLARFPLENMVKYLPSGLSLPYLNDRLPKLADLIQEPSFEALYQHMVSHWKNPEQIVLGGQKPPSLFTIKNLSTFQGTFEYMMYWDMMTYLPDDILVKVDRASMAASLEARVPLLDHRITEFSWKVPISLKYKKGKGKWLLRQVLYRYLPPKLVDRTKMGFGIPIEYWLRGPLREWAEALLDEKRLREEGFFEPSPIRKMWQEHLSGQRRWHYYLWDVLMFQAWLEKYHK